MSESEVYKTRGQTVVRIGIDKPGDPSTLAVPTIPNLGISLTESDVVLLGLAQEAETQLMLATCAFRFTRIDPPPTTVDLSLLLNKVCQTFYAGLAPCYSPGWLFTGIKYQVPDLPYFPPSAVEGTVGEPRWKAAGEFMFAVPQPGTGPALKAGQGLPTYVAATFHKNTGVPGRNWRGGLRSWIEDEELVDGNEYIPLASPKNLLVANENWIWSYNVTVPPNSTNALYQPFVFSKTRWLTKSIALGNVPGNCAKPIVTMAMNLLVGSQISRKQHRQAR